MEDPWSSPWTSDVLRTTTTTTTDDLDKTDRTPRPEATVSLEGGWDEDTSTAQQNGWMVWDDVAAKQEAVDEEDVTESLTKPPRTPWGAESPRTNVWEKSGPVWDNEARMEEEAGAGGVEAEHEFPDSDGLGGASDPPSSDDTSASQQPDGQDWRDTPGKKTSSTSVSIEKLAAGHTTMREQTSHTPMSMPDFPTALTRPPPLRQSSKVQDLVEMYDDIARKSGSPTSASFTKPTPQPLDEDSSVAADGRTDSAQDHIEPANTPGSSPRDTTPRKLSTMEEAADHAETQKPESVRDDTRSTSIEPLLGQSGAPSYYPNMSVLDDLFPSVNSAFPAPESLPQQVISASFDSISERKAWYRVSRFGSARKYDAGDDDDRYVRVTWQASHVRQDSLKIIRRWMEEDSMDGRAVLGRSTGGVRGARMFNWNSTDAPEVDIGKLIRKNRRKPSAVVTSLAAVEKGDVPSFGWNSTETTVGANGLSAPVAAQATLTPTSSRAGLASMTDGSAMGSVSQPVLQSHEPSMLGISRDSRELEAPDQDDDEWGDMVMSPGQEGFSIEDLPPSVQPSSSPQPEHVNTVAADSPVMSITSRIRSPLPGFSHAKQDGKQGTKPPPPSVTPFPFHMEPMKPIPSPPMTGGHSRTRLSTDDLDERASSESPARATSSKMDSACHEAGEEEDTDTAVQHVLNNLPDLRYMFR